MKWLSRRTLLFRVTTLSLLFNNVKCLSINANVCRCWKDIYFLFLYHFHTHNCFVDYWNYNLLRYKLVTHYCFLYFKFLTAFATFHVEVLTMWYIVISKVLQHSSASSLHCSLSRGWLHTEILICYYYSSMNAYIWNYVWNRACVFCCSTQACHLCYCLQYVNTFSVVVVHLFLLLSTCVVEHNNNIPNACKITFSDVSRLLVLYSVDPLLMVPCICFDSFDITLFHVIKVMTDFPFH